MDKDRTDTAGKAADATHKLTENALDAGRDYYRNSSRAIATTVQEQPLGSLVAAAIVGFMLALVITR